MEFIELKNKKDYESFVSSHPKAHFMQSYYWGQVMINKNFEPHYVVLKDNDKIVASALMLKKNLLAGYCYYYIPRGFILDYSDFDLIKKFTKYIREFAKKNKGVFIKIDPDIKLHNLDLDGKVIDEINNFKLLRYLNKIGYKHMGFFKGFVGEQPRYTFRLNLDDSWENIYKKIHPTTKKILNKGNQYNLDMYIGDSSDIEYFYQTMKETAERENIRSFPIKYYKNFYNILNKNDMCDLYVVKVKLKNLVKTYKNKVDSIKDEINNLDSGKYKNEEKKNNLLNDLNNKLEKAQLELENVKKINIEEITLSSIMTVKYGDKVWTIHGGNSTLLRELNSNYLLYHQIIKDAYDNGYKLIDFFGTSGDANPDKNDPNYGIHNFKKRLGGEYTEFIGEFDLVINKFMYFTYKRLIPLYRKIQKRKTS